MDIHHHFIIGLVLSVALLPFYGWLSLIALIPSVLLDFDHYILYVLKHNNLSLRKAVRYHSGGCGRHHLCIFHTAEFLFVLGMFAFFSKVFFILFIATFLHLFFDYIEWFLWFSYYSERIPSLLLAPLILKRGRQIDRKIKGLGGKCIVCGFDKAFDSHLIFGYGEVLVCPNHHYMVHKGLIAEKELIRLDKRRIK